MSHYYYPQIGLRVIVGLLLSMLLLNSMLPVATISANPPQVSLSEVGALSGGITAVAVSGTLAVAGTLEGLELIDISDPASPALVSSLDLGGEIKDLVVEGDLAYLANYGGWLQIVDLSNPLAPRLRGSLATNGSPHGIDIADGRAVIANYNGGFQIIAISDPDAPALIGQASGESTRGSVLDVQITDTVVWVVTYGGLARFDISDPTSPTGGMLIDVIQLFSANSRGVEIVGDRAYLAMGTHGLGVFDLNAPVGQQTVTVLDTPGYPMDVQVVGNRAYLAEREYGFQLVDLSDPDRPQLLGRFNTPGSTDRLAVVGTRVFLPDTGGGLIILDTADDRLERLGSYGVGGDITKLSVHGDRAYLAGAQGFTIVDISIPARPHVLGSLYLFGNADNVVVAGNVAYVSTDLRDEGNYRDEIIWIIDVADLTRPQVLSSLRIEGAGVRDLAILGTTLYAATYNLGLLLIDVTDPTAPGNPVRPAFLPNLAVGAITLTGSRAYLDTGEVLDVSMPTAPALLGTLPLTSSVVLGASGTTVYALERIIVFAHNPPPWEDRWREKTTFKLFDGSDLSAPMLLGSYTVDPTTIRSVTIDGPMAYLLTETPRPPERGFEILDISDPTRPTRIAQPTLRSVPDVLLPTPELLFAGGYRQGLRIYTRDQRFLAQSGVVTDDTPFVSADDTMRLRFDPASLTQPLHITQLEKLTPGHAPAEGKTILRSFMIEAHTSTGNPIGQASQPYTLSVDVEAAQPAAAAPPTVAYWDGAAWVVLPPCTSCAAQAGQLVVQTTHFGEFALVTDAQPPDPEITSIIYLPVLAR